MATLDESLAKAIRTDWRAAPITDAERVMLTYVETLTRDTVQVQLRDHGALRTVGFNDQSILQIRMIAGFFSYINRVADGLGVGRGQAVR